MTVILWCYQLKWNKWAKRCGVGVGKSKCMLNLQYCYQIVNCGSVYFWTKEIHDSILHYDNDDNNENLTANVTLTPCTLALLKKAAATALGARGFSHLVPSSWFFSWFFPFSRGFIFFAAHCVRKFSLLDIWGLVSLILQRANVIHAMCTFLLQ